MGIKQMAVFHVHTSIAFLELIDPNHVGYY